MDGKCRACRKFSEKLFLKGERCNSPKCALIKRDYAPGAHGGGRHSKKSEYGLQLQEKQKAKAEYGLREQQFRLTFQRAARSSEATGEAMLKILESRLDNIIYRLGWAQSRSQARQLVNHGHIKVNGKMVDIPSYCVKAKDKIEPMDNELIERTKVEKMTPPAWIKVKGAQADIERLPLREEIDVPINEQLVVEFYSR